MPLKYARVVDDKTKLCEVGIGTDIEFYKSIGMQELNVEQCEWNCSWYLAGYVPQEPEERAKKRHIAELKAQLAELDNKSNRSMRAILAGTATEDDRAFEENH